MTSFIQSGLTIYDTGDVNAFKLTAIWHPPVCAQSTHLTMEAMEKLWQQRQEEQGERCESGPHWLIESYDDS